MILIHITNICTIYLNLILINKINNFKYPYYLPIIIIVITRDYNYLVLNINTTNEVRIFQYNN